MLDYKKTKEQYIVTAFENINCFEESYNSKPTSLPEWLQPINPKKNIQNQVTFLQESAKTFLTGKGEAFLETQMQQVLNDISRNFQSHNSTKQCRILNENIENAKLQIENPELYKKGYRCQNPMNLFAKNFFLYKYYKIPKKIYNNELIDDIESCIKWLTEKTIKYSPPLSFNDIYDCVPKTQDLPAHFNDNDLHQIRNRFKISCFSERWDNHAMWGNYAENFTGFVVKYKLFSFDNHVIPCDYENKYEQYSNKFFYSILRKSKDWSHEKEWRAFLNFQDKEEPIDFEYIILGNKMKQENIEIIKQSLPAKVKTLKMQNDYTISYE